MIENNIPTDFRDKVFPWSKEKIKQYIHTYYDSPPVKGHLVSKAIVGLLAFLIRSLSWKGADRLGTFFGNLCYLFKIRRTEAMINMDIAYGDSKTAEEKDTIYKNMWLNIGRHVLNYIRVPQMDEEFLSNFEIVNEELLREVYNRGKGVVFIGGHIGEWEIGCARAGMAGYPISMVAKRLPNPIINKFINDARLGMNLGIIPHRKSMERLLEGIKLRGEGVTMAVDQNMKRSQGIFVKWMGKTASSPRSIAWITKATGAPVVAGYAAREAPGIYKLFITEEVPWEDHEDPEEEMLINTRHQARAVEKIIFARPELWLWIHRRWKVQPEGEPNPYQKNSQNPV